MRSKTLRQAWAVRVMKLHILLMVFVVSQQHASLVIWGSGLVIIALYAPKWLPMLLRMPQKRFLLWGGMLAIIAGNILWSEYPVDRMLQSTFQLLVVSLIAGEDFMPQKAGVDWFFLLFSILLIGKIYVSHHSNSVLTFTNFADQNYAAMIVFLYFLYSAKRASVIGVGISFLFLLVTETRLYATGMAACLLILLLRKTAHLNGMNDKAMRPKEAFAMLMMLLAVSVAVSLVWSVFVVGAKTVPYKEGVNDVSNAIRTNSNLYAFKVLARDERLFWRGYDAQIRGALGIGADVLHWHATFLGLRVVQPHNSLLNPLLTHGVAYTALYFTALSVALAKHFRMRNLMLWLPYLLMSLAMHSLLSNFFLMFWAMDLIVPPKKSGRRLYVNWRKHT